MNRALLVAAATSTLLLAAPAAADDNPYDLETRELSRQVSRAGRAAAGMIPLLELWRSSARATPSVVRDELARLAADRRLPPARRAYVGALLARARLRAGEAQGARQDIAALGYVTTFRIAGPFDNEGKAGFDRELGPEARPAAPPDLEAQWPGRERAVGWRPYRDVSSFGYVDLDSHLRPNANACAIAETVVRSERAQPLTLFLGAGGAVRAWWNGEQVLHDDAYRRADPDRHVAVIGAHEGNNRLMVKVCVTDTTWGFYARIGDRDGAPAQGVSVSIDDTPEVTAGHAVGVRLPRAPAAPLAELEAAATGDRAHADALEALARFLVYTGADDPAEHRARQLSRRAADVEPTVERLALAAQLAEQRGEAMGLAARALELAPDHPLSLLLQARVRRTGPAPEEALPLLGRVPGEGVEALEAALLRAEVLVGLELPQAALRALRVATGDVMDAPFFQARLAEAEDAAGHADRHIELRRRAVTSRHDDMESRRSLIADAVRRRQHAAAVEHVEVLRALAPGSAGNLRYVSGIYEAIGRTDDALAVLTEARELAPEDAGLLVAQGQLFLRLDQADAAAEALRLALEYRPQDAATRELLEQMTPQERQDEAYAATSEQLLARASDETGYPYSVLQQLTVNTVFENGLGSSFHQVAVQVHDAEGARRFRTYPIQFDPGAQRVDVRLARVYRDGRTLESLQSFEQQLGEPWYRIYYDTRALVVVFPDLEPGDIVELRYRLDDVAHRNLFADYYGDLHFLQGDAPVRSLDYVLITPASREFFFNEPGLDGLTHEQRRAEGRRIDRFHAEDVPPIRSEDGMPGMTEIAPYLHVSTYRTWQDVGTWYWGLIQDQLYADESLRRTVRELVDGARDTREKVERIQNWVVRNTRYVGLEFGIHGYKPYRVPQIVARGFGDCKDKASLLFTMMREAGIDAHVVLVRTRRNGSITDLPASLAVFDHAIAYVPDLDLYIDGTAEHSGVTELPNMDQGVTVLHVWQGGAELRRSPVLPANRNRRTRTMDIALAEDGSADVSVEEEVVGAQAPGYRSTYQAEGTRGDRFERSLRTLFPGLTLVSQEFSDLSDLGAPIRIEYRARVPQMAQRDGDALRIAPAVMDDLVRSMARTPTRRYPLDLGGTSSYVEQRTVRLPRGYRVSDVPDGGAAESRFGRVRLTVETTDGRVQTRTELEVRRDRVAPEDYEDFRRWVQQADRLLRQRIGATRGGQ